MHAFPHDPSACTQDLAWRDGFFYEGTGLKGRSSLSKIRLETGEIVKQVDLAPEFFGEGITFYKNEIIQVAWLSHIGFVYDGNDVRLLPPFSYKGEGWGLAANSAPNSNELFMSDG